MVSVDDMPELFVSFDSKFIISIYISIILLKILGRLLFKKIVWSLYRVTQKVRITDKAKISINEYSLNP